MFLTEIVKFNTNSQCNSKLTANLKGSIWSLSKTQMHNLWLTRLNYNDDKWRFSVECSSVRWSETSTVVCNILGLGLRILGLPINDKGGVYYLYTEETTESAGVYLIHTVHTVHITILIPSYVKQCTIMKWEVSSVSFFWFK